MDPERRGYGGREEGKGSISLLGSPREHSEVIQGDRAWGNEGIWDADS